MSRAVVVGAPESAHDVRLVYLRGVFGAVTSVEGGLWGDSAIEGGKHRGVQGWVHERRVIFFGMVLFVRHFSGR